MTPRIFTTDVAVGRPKEKPRQIAPTEVTGDRMVWRLPPQVGSGLFTTHCMPSGLTMTLSRCTLQNGLHARLRPGTDDCTLAFTIRGHAVNRNSFFKRGFEVEPGSNCLCWFSDPELTRDIPREEHLESLVLTFPMDILHDSSLVEAGAEAFLDGLLDKRAKAVEYCLEKNVNSPAIVMILEQIIHCPYQGRTRRFYLEAKALELLALKLEAVSGMLGTADGVSDQKLHGVLAARDALLKDLRAPPSIHDLTRIAGMSHPVLGKYFKAVFGCSPFQFLRMKRLEWSLELVRGNEMSLTEIAHATGFASSSHFSKAFLERYGIQPSQYRKEKAGNPFYSIPSLES